MSKRLNTEEFINRAKKIHGAFYDYSEVNYINASTKVKIICPEHGEFFQLPHNHLSGKMCNECAKIKRGLKRRISPEQFIEHAKEIHRNKYDYSDTKYISSKTKVKIICPEHGSFTQQPFNHLSGQGCPLCGFESRVKKRALSQEEFIKKAINIHGNKYDYSKVVYKNYITKIEIVCNEEDSHSNRHGSFWQTPNDHLSGKGCPKCKAKSIHDSFALTQEDFIKKAKEVHGNKYDYSKVEYINTQTKVKIICPVHDEFEQLPSNHLAGKGCLECSGHKQLTTDEFIEKSKRIHGDKYDYTETEYVRYNDKVKISCPIHGEFWQSPGLHMSGTGCPTCGVESSKKGNNSEQENKLSVRLKSSFPNTQRQYRDERYPYFSDFYIPERDLFIEYNGYWTHGTHWYNPDSEDDVNAKIHHELKNPDWCPLAWWTSDIEKRKAAKKNNLNYVVLWNEQDIEDWFALGCPDGQDWKKEYSWKLDKHKK